MKLHFKTISAVILSPRMQKALYKGVDFEEVGEDVKIEELDNINIVYPFYSYENRELLSGQDFSYAKEYYIPVSSLKGVLLGQKKGEEENTLRSKILFQDIRISKSHIRLRHLYKFQYLYQETQEDNANNKGNDKKKPKFTLFFPNIAIEMIEDGKEFESEVLLKMPDLSEEFFRNKLNESFEITKKKLENYMKETEKRIGAINSWEIKAEDCLDKLKGVKASIQQQLEGNKKCIFLGGYKGLLGSLSQLEIKDESHKIQNGFYIDKDTLLPYGLVEVEIS